MQTLKPKKPDLNRPKIVRNPGLRRQVWERDQGICGYCGRFDPKWTHEHDLALWQSGPDTLENSKTSCRQCMRAKTDRETTQRAKADRLAVRDQLTRRRRALPA